MIKTIFLLLALSYLSYTINAGCNIKNQDLTVDPYLESINVSMNVIGNFVGDNKNLITASISGQIL